MTIWSLPSFPRMRQVEKLNLPWSPQVCFEQRAETQHPKSRFQDIRRNSSTLNAKQVYLRYSEPWLPRPLKDPKNGASDNPLVSNVVMGSFFFWGGGGGGGGGGVHSWDPLAL